MSQNGDMKSRVTLLSMVVAAAVMVSGFNALVQVVKTLTELIR